MRVRVLGDLEVVVAGGVVDLGGPKPRALLAQLVVAEGRPVPVEQLIDQMWGESPPERVVASLQSYVARLRRALERDRDPQRPGQRLRTHAGAYSLDVAADEVDARRFVALVRDGRACAATDPDRAVQLFDEALALWHGNAYSALPGPALEAEATRLDEMRLAALTQLWELRLRRGEHAEAVAELEPLTRLYPLREQLWGLLALALYRTARQGDALAALRRVRENLAEELGVDPTPELRRLEEAILRQEPTLDLPPPPPPAPAPVLTAPDVRADGSGAVGASPEPEADDERLAEDSLLFGREPELCEALRVLDAAAAGRGRTIVVSGEPGIGKTRFGEALAARAAAAGFRTARGGWEPEACPPLWGWTRAVSQLLGDADLLTAQPEVTDAASASFRQADALLTRLREGPPSLLVLDDVHWADAASLRLLRRVAAELDGVPVVLVVLLRSAPGDIPDQVADVLAALARLEPVRIHLGGLGPKAVKEWVARQAGLAISDDVAAELVDHADGNPFFVTELVRLLVSEGALSDVRSPAWHTVPHAVRDVVRQRLASLAEPTVTVLRTAAVAGRSFDLTVVSDVIGDHAVMEDALEAAQVLGLVDEELPGRYRFTHALVRNAVRESMSAPARVRVHAAVAAALERAHSGRVAEHAAELAEHYRLAGPAYRRSAWVFAKKAGQAAASRSAHDAALRLFSDAAELQEDDPTTEPTEREEVLLGRVRALTRLGRPLEAWEPAAQAARSALVRGDSGAAAAALLAVTEAMVWGWRSSPEWDDEAIALWEEVLAAQPAEETLTRAHLTAAIAVELLYRPGSADRGTWLADEAVSLVRSTGRTGYPELQVLRLAQMALLRPDLLHHRASLANEIVALASRVGEPSDLAAALNARAQDHGERARLHELHSDVLRAHELAERHHLSQNLMVSGWCLALRRQLDGDLEGAEQAIRDLEAFQATLAMSGRGIGLCQLANLRELQGRLPEVEPALRQAGGSHPALRELHALALLRTGATDQLRLLLGPYAEQPDLSFDYMWLPFMAIRAEVWCGLGDVEAARDLYAQLAPYADRLAFSVPVTFRGSMQLTLGELARVTGDTSVARQHLQAALRVHAELGLQAWVGRTEEALSRLDRADR